MDLKNNQISMGEIIKNEAARTVLKREFPQLSNPLMMSMAKGMTLADVIEIAKGRVPGEQLTRVLRELEEA